ncbi:MAG: hypothetical protein WDO14_05255 [Bacteroidota bacterium]
MSKAPKTKSGLWGAPQADHKPRKKRELKNPDVFFTLKVYSQISGRKDRSLKFSLDFNAPFQANTDDLEPYYVNPKDERAQLLFREILEHVAEVYRYVGDPVNYRPDDDKDYKLTDGKSERGTQQARLAQILELAGNRINSVFYEQASANRVGVSVVALSDGNGDPRPPRKP